ncbi:MAG TPA: DNA mismatch repair endonuclease MutL [Clostridiales bacterium]|nr:DNA mismatch repair endonuclease MutL [Clostridiales bacterium]
MASIKILDQSTTNKIAAGEVIDGPASVVKELVENSIDAKSSNITIEIKNGGKDYIRVSDDGVGMSEQDSLLAFKRHATSKIQTIDDISNIESLGFRGEALASICSVAMVELQTKRHDEIIGTFIENHGGKVVQKQQIGCNSGTTVIVKNLFYNVPARLKFLKSSGIETGLITDLITRFILGNTNIAFKYYNNGKLILSTTGNGSLKDAAYVVYGRELSKHLLKVDNEIDNIKIYGYIGMPSATKHNRSYQTFFVNGRYIKHDLLSNALQQGYKALIMKNKFPVAILNIVMAPHNIDVNVHPSKLMIKFKDEKKVYNAIYSTVEDALAKNHRIKKFRGFYDQSEKTLSVKEENRINGSRAEGHVLEIEDGVHPSMFDISAENFPKSSLIEGIKQLNNDNNITDDQVPDYRIIGQVFSTYIIVEKDDVVYLIDQHAAHERILYQRYMEMYNNQNIGIQYLLTPMIIEVNAYEKEIIETNIQTLNKLGYVIEPFGDMCYAIRAVPMIFHQPAAVDAMVKEMLSLDRGKSPDKNGVPRLKESAIITMACKSAIKANMRLKTPEILALLQQITKEQIPNSCPHGRPIVITISKYRLEKLFKRVL